MEYYSSFKKKEILLFVTTGVNLEGVMLSEISQIERNKYYMVSLICGIKKAKTKPKTNRSQSHRNRIEKWLPGFWGRVRDMRVC